MSGSKAKNLALLGANVDATGEVDSNTIDGIDSAQFLRSDTADTMYGQLTIDGFDGDVGLSFRDGYSPVNVGVRAKAITTVNRDGLELLGYNGIDLTINNGATVALHVNGQGIVGAGNVGIGTVDPQAEFHVKGGSTMKSRIVDDGSNTLTCGLWDGSNIRIEGAGKPIRIDSYGGHLEFATSGSGRGAITNNVNSSGLAGLQMYSGSVIGLDQSGVRSWLISASNGNLYVSSGDGGGTTTINNKLNVSYGATVGPANGGYSTTSFCCASTFTAVSGGRYLHIRLPDRYNQGNNKMFRLHIRGYCLDVSANRVLDCIISGYITNVSNGGPLASVSVWDATGQYSPTAYYSSGQNVGYARIYIPNAYYSTITVDTQQVGNGDVILPGELTFTYSTSSIL